MLSGLFLLSSDWYNFAARFLKPPTGVYPAQLAVGWSLGVELTFYLLAPFLLRSWRLFAVGFLFSMGCRLFVNFAITTDPYDHITWMYFFLPTSLIFFLTGHLARLIYTWGRLPAAIGWASLAGSFAISTNQMSGLVDGPLALFSVVLFALALPAVFEATKNNRVLNFLGDQTYPLYLTHMVAIQIFFGAYGSWFAYGPQLLSWAKTMPTPRIGGTIVVAAFLGFAMVVTIAAYYIELLVKAIIAKLSHAALSQFRRIGSPPLVGPVVSASVGGTSVNRFAEAEGPIR
jgi:peptidoglycan/LPS O-acetylase OafA/YrhL